MSVGQTVSTQDSNRDREPSGSSRSARWYSARPPRVVLVVAGVLLGLASLSLSLHSLTVPSVYRIDFLQDYVLARAIAAGANPYAPTRDLAQQYLAISVGAHFPHPTPHPPPDGILFLPLTLLGYTAAARVWFGLELLFLIASVYLLARTAGRRWSPWTVGAVAIALNAWYPVSEDLGSGQVMLLLLLLLAIARLNLLSRRSFLGGVFIGLAILVKPVPWPLLLLLTIRRDWWALASSIATIAAGYATAAALIGPSRLLFYLTDVLPPVTAGYRAIARNMSLWTIGWRVFDGTQPTVFGGTVLPAIAAPPLVRWPEGAALVSVGLPAALILAACFAVWRKNDLDVGFGLMICVSILVSPTSWSNYYVLALIPAAQVLTGVNGLGLPSRETVAMAVVGVILFVPVFGWAVLGFLLAAQAPPAGLIGTLPFVPSLLTLSPAVAVAALGWLVAWYSRSHQIPAGECL